MRILGYLLMVIFLFIGCTPKRSMNVADGLLLDTTPIVWTNDTSLGVGDFVFDTTFQRLHLDIEDNITSLNKEGEEVSSAEMAFKIAEPMLIDTYGKENILLQKPFRINLVDDIWVIYGTLPLANGKMAVGGTAYIEIRKKNGELVKMIHEK